MTEFEFHISPARASSRPHVRDGTAATRSKRRSVSNGSEVRRCGAVDGLGEIGYHAVTPSMHLVAEDPEPPGPPAADRALDGDPPPVPCASRNRRHLDREPALRHGDDEGRVVEVASGPALDDGGERLEHASVQTDGVPAGTEWEPVNVDAEIAFKVHARIVAQPSQARIGVGPEQAAAKYPARRRFRPRRAARIRPAGAESGSVAATQEALYQAHDLELSWSEASLPERERTKHVHRLHPYLGKFIPQLVETLLDRHVPAGGRVLDPFSGSGTTLVQALESGYDATGVDIAGFNALLARVKTRPYNLEALRRDLLWAHAEVEAFEPRGRYPRGTTAYVRAWFAPAAAEELLHFRSLIEQVGSADVLRIVLARSARSARRTAHFDLEFPREPQREPYWCFKHRRECKPVESARRFLLRYTLDTLERIEGFSVARADDCVARVLHGDARAIDLEGPYDGVITSPPYPGLIDYHEQHRYAYELLGVDERRDLELGRPARGTGRAAIEDYVDGVAQVLANARASLTLRGRMCIVVNDRRDLYPEILRRADLRLVDRHERHVNRRTGRRAGEYFESILVVAAT